MCARKANPELRGMILDAAQDIVENCGPDCVTMREVAEKIGYSPTSIYLHFPDKQAMLQALISNGFEDLTVSLRSWAVGPTPLDKLRQRSHGYLVWGVDHPGMYQLMFESRIEIDASPIRDERARQGLADGALVLRDAIETGQLRAPEDPDAFGNAMWAGLHGVTSLTIARRFRGEETASRDELIAHGSKLADAITSALLEPLLVRESARA